MTPDKHQQATYWIMQSKMGKLPTKTDLALGVLIARIIELCEPLENK